MHTHSNFNFQLYLNALSAAELSTIVIQISKHLVAEVSTFVLDPDGNELTGPLESFSVAQLNNVIISFSDNDLKIDEINVGFSRDKIDLSIKISDHYNTILGLLERELPNYCDILSIVIENSSVYWAFTDIDQVIWNNNGMPSSLLMSFYYNYYSHDLLADLSIDNVHDYVQQLDCPVECKIFEMPETGYVLLREDSLADA